MLEESIENFAWIEKNCMIEFITTLLRLSKILNNKNL